MVVHYHCVAEKLHYIARTNETFLMVFLFSAFGQSLQVAFRLTFRELTLRMLPSSDPRVLCSCCWSKPGLRTMFISKKIKNIYICFVVGLVWSAILMWETSVKKQFFLSVLFLILPRIAAWLNDSKWKTCLVAVSWTGCWFQQTLPSVP